MSAEIRQQLLEGAITAVMKDRNASYEEPEQSFGTISKLWTVYLDAKIDPTLGPADVSLMMILLKVARLINNPSHYDSALDVAGYAACLADVAQQDANPSQS